jgi:hypothetical protein
MLFISPEHKDLAGTVTWIGVFLIRVTITVHRCALGGT